MYPARPPVPDAGPAPLVRVPPRDAAAIQQALDAGAAGVIVPQVNSREDAEQAVRACLYPPEGCRGMDPRRCTGYGIRFHDYVEVERNPHYWDADAVWLNGLRFYAIENPYTEARAFLAGQLHTTYVLQPDLVDSIRMKVVPT